MAGGTLALAAGLLSQMVVAALFGAGADMDAFLTAIVIPNFLTYALVGGLSFVLIPAFLHESASGSDEDAWAMVGTTFWMTLVILMLVALIGSVFSRQIISITAANLNPDKAELSAQMLGILMFMVPAAGLGYLAQGVENARKSFFWPSVAQGIGSVGNIFVLVSLFSRFGPISLAWGSLVAAILAAWVTVLPLLRHGGHKILPGQKLLPFKDPRIKELLRLMAPFLIFGLLTQSTMVFERYFASVLPDGDLSYLGYAYKISNFLVLILATGIATAIFPVMAESYSKDGIAGLAGNVDFSLRLTLAVALPIIAFLGAVSVPLVTLLFEGGAFTHQHTLSVSRVVLVILIGNVLFRMIANVISRAFFTMKDTLTFTLVSALTVLAYLFAAKPLMSSFGYVGLAASLTLQMGLVCLLTLFLLFRKLPRVHPQKLIRDSCLYLVLSLVVGVVAFVLVNIFSKTVPALQLVISACISGVLYLAILYFQDKEMVLLLIELVGVRVMGAKWIAQKLKP